jgi:hypothetical protein
MTLTIPSRHDRQIRLTALSIAAAGSTLFGDFNAPPGRQITLSAANSLKHAQKIQECVKVEVMAPL